MKPQGSPYEPIGQPTCHYCKRSNVTFLHFGFGRLVCLPCTREKQVIHYQHIVNWINDHPPITPLAPGEAPTSPTSPSSLPQHDR